MEWDLNTILSKLKLTFPQFVDFCILTGCDYTEPIPGITINESLYYIQKYKTIENCLPLLQKKYNVNIDQETTLSNTEESSHSTFFNYKRARELFHTSLEEECVSLSSTIKLNTFQLSTFQTLLHSINCTTFKINDYCCNIQQSIQLFNNIHTKS